MGLLPCLFSACLAGTVLGHSSFTLPQGRWREIYQQAFWLNLQMQSFSHTHINWFNSKGVFKHFLYVSIFDMQVHRRMLLTSLSNLWRWGPSRHAGLSTWLGWSTASWRNMVLQLILYIYIPMMLVHASKWPRRCQLKALLLDMSYRSWPPKRGRRNLVMRAVSFIV